MPINVGGDDSVKWDVNVQSVRNGTVKSYETGGKGHHQEGVDETRVGDRFTITIKLPKDPTDTFLAELRTAANNPGGNKVTFTLPIEAKNYDQIHIDWPSDTAR